MNQPTRLIKIHVREKSTPIKRKLPKWLIYFFTIAQLSYGFNFGFVNPTSKKFKYADKTMMIFMAFVMMILQIPCFLMEGVIEKRWVLMYFVHFIPTLITLFFSSHSLFVFLTEMIAILDEQSRDSTVNKVGLIAWLYITSSFVFNAATEIFFYSSLLPIFIEMSWSGLDVISVANFVIFYLVFLCTRNLKEELDGQEIGAERFNTTFIAIANSFEKFRRSYDAIFFWGFFADSLKWMNVIWNQLVYIQTSYPWSQLGCGSVWAVVFTMKMIAPALCAEMINVEIDAIKMILRKRCLMETDEAVSTEWARVLHYVKARPLLRKAWRLVPVDLQQPITMLSICTTYLIVIIQFTHLFD